MFSKYDFIRDLNPTKEDWRIKVRVLRSWKVPNFQRRNLDDNLEMVLLDEQFDTIANEGHGSPYLVDVIGLLYGIGEVREHVIAGRKTKMVVLELDNLSGKKLECTLWEQYVDEVQTFLASNYSAQNVIIIQLARIKGFKGITNTKYTTRIITDSSVPEIAAFRKRCLSSDLVDSSQLLTQLSSQSSYSFENDFLKDTERKCINDIKDCSEVTTCITYGTIKSIENKYNWWYKSCKRCPYSVSEDFEKWYCNNCQKHWSDYHPKFSVQVRVVDGTDSASFILFDKDCVALLGMSVVDLRENHFKRGADLETYPSELNGLNGKSMLFKEDTTFDDAVDNCMVPSEPEKVADFESQTCGSTNDDDVSLTLLTPSENYNDSMEDKFNCSVVRPLKKIKLEKDFDAEVRDTAKENDDV
ncbi:uncharacterized protein LOC133317485 [Gastrolobium bilobum]|uniref:uncharacterized protein LOC133317485 n=1 Tax=Gastrolobium bilobum TaxID=150636 RepID=UPI002AB2AC81|nr:uncharacterized protein LOC133317485 [Gastrolobium bilobum]